MSRHHHHKRDKIAHWAAKRITITDDGALIGKLSFNATTEGRKAEGMVKRGEIGAVSIGYRVTSWLAEDDDGNSVDPDAARWDNDLTFTATRWELLEASLVCVPADGSAMVRSLGGDDNTDIETIRARMLSRQRMYERTQVSYLR